LKNINDIIDEVWTHERENNCWSNSKNEKIRSLTIDGRGKIGELFLIEEFKDHYRENIKIERKKTDRGHWDVIIYEIILHEKKYENITFEIKTSSLDKKQHFQTEGLKPYNNFQFLFVLGIAPTKEYFKLQLKKDIDFSKLHKREGRSGNGWKWDFKLKEMIIYSRDKLIQEFEKLIMLI